MYRLGSSQCLPQTMRGWKKCNFIILKRIYGFKGQVWQSDNKQIDEHLVWQIGLGYCQRYFNSALKNSIGGNFSLAIEKNHQAVRLKSLSKVPLVQYITVGKVHSKKVFPKN